MILVSCLFLLASFFHSVCELLMVNCTRHLASFSLFGRERWRTSTNEIPFKLNKLMLKHLTIISKSLLYFLDCCETLVRERTSNGPPKQVKWQSPINLRRMRKTIAHSHHQMCQWIFGGFINFNLLQFFCAIDLSPHNHRLNWLLEKDA